MATTAIQSKRRVSIIARILAPLALAAALIAVLIVISGSSSSSDEQSHKHHKGGNGKPDQSQQADQDTYVVQSGDTLEGISQKTGVGVAQLQRLNPDVDTQALAPGSTLKLH
jgi:LysM repeat protein